MIILTRLGNGMPIAVNPDLIERAEHTPDTVVTLVDGHKLVIEEPLDTMIGLIRTWRASIAAEAITMAKTAAQDAPHTSTLAAVRNEGQESRDNRGSDDDDKITQAAVMAEPSAHGSPLGQVLHLHSREV